MTVPLLASRPRTLVLTLSSDAIEAVMLGPTGLALLPAARVARDADPQQSFAAMWPELEAFGEFDRISVLTGPGLGDGWIPLVITGELERQSLRPVRLSTIADLRWSHVIKGAGVELVIAPGEELDSSLFLDGKSVPGLAIGRHVFRKGRTYQEYLAPRVLERKGVRAWTKRLGRAAAEILAVWNPAMLYIAVPTGVTLDLDLGPSVAIVAAPTGIDGALALWT